MKRFIVAIVSIGFVAAIVLGYLWLQRAGPGTRRSSRLHTYWQDPAAYEEWTIHAGTRCGEAPFVMPTDGLVGFLWGDSFRPGHSHQGIDIFGPSGPDGLGLTPVVAAYDGYLTRLPDWRSSIIIRIPQDPLHTNRQIWMYYTHMADSEGGSFIVDAFPPGAYEIFVTAGTLLGYQGNYSADPDNPTGMHLHFSIVKDDEEGSFMNELSISNTLDPTPYLGIPLNADLDPDTLSICQELP